MSTKTEVLEPPAARLSIRVSATHADHHIWSNHGHWWVHFTLHGAGFTKTRIRRSLGTRHIDEARQIRDFLFAVLPGADGISTPEGLNP